MSFRTCSWQFSTILFALIGGAVLTACCPYPPGDPRCLSQPTYAAPSPTPPSQSSNSAPTQWQNETGAGQYAQVIEGTTQVIAAGKDAKYYTQARLYRGLAEFKRNGDLKAARDDLAIAKEGRRALSAEEQLLLFRTQMAVLAKLGDTAGARTALNDALGIAPPAQQDAIRKEYDNALKP